MSEDVVSNENATTPRSGGISLLELFLSMTVVGVMAGMFFAQFNTLSKDAEVRDVIAAHIEKQGELKPCSAVVGTIRREGMCGSFHEYTVLTGGREMYVFTGPENAPTFAGTMSWMGNFIPNERLTTLALGE